MRKWSRIAFVFLLLALVGGIAWLALRPGEPMYKGKRLSDWLEEYDPKAVNFIGSSYVIEYSDARKESDDAVRHIGTNAIPILLKRLQSKDAPLTDRLFALAQKQHFVTVHNVPAKLRRHQGVEGFGALGAKGSDAVPVLIKLYGKVSPECRPYIAEVLGNIGPDAKKAVPFLILGLGDTNMTAFMAAGAVTAEALGKIHSEPQLAVPALIECLTNRNTSIRWAAATAIGLFHGDARSAIRALNNCSKNDSDQWVRIMASTSRQEIGYAWDLANPDPD
jgi:HEAT repeat protein